MIKTLPIKRAPSQEGLFAPAPFIVGTGRSGTTLLRMMLDSHPALAIPAETHFIPRVVANHEAASDPRASFIQTLASYPKWPDFVTDISELEHRVNQIRPFDLAHAFRAFYMLHAERFGKQRWGDKTPRYLQQMQLIQRVLPDARFIHLIRDARDVALSVKGLWFGPNSISEIAQWWAAGIRQARRQAKELNYYLEVRYEDLVCNTESTLRKICAFIDLPWHAAMLDYHQTAHKRLEAFQSVTPDGKTVIDADKRRDIHRLTNKPPQASRVGRWRTEMSVPDRQHMEASAGGLLEKLGYEVSQPHRDHEGPVDSIGSLEMAIEEIERMIPVRSTFVLVDQDGWGTDDYVADRRRLPFLEKEGMYWGPPADDQTAIRELERLRTAGADFVVIGWPGFWWLDHYAGFHQHLRSHFHCILANKRLMVFDLRLSDDSARPGGPCESDDEHPGSL